MEKSVRTHANNYLFLLDFYNDYELVNFAEVVTRIAARKSVVSSARIRKLLLPQSVFLFALISTVLAFALPLLVHYLLAHYSYALSARSASQACQLVRQSVIQSVRHSVNSLNCQLLPCLCVCFFCCFGFVFVVIVLNAISQLFSCPALLSSCLVFACRLPSLYCLCALVYIHPQYVCVCGCVYVSSDAKFENVLVFLLLYQYLPFFKLIFGLRLSAFCCQLN